MRTLIGQLVGFVGILAISHITAVYWGTKYTHLISSVFTIYSANTLQISILCIYVSCKLYCLSAEELFPLSAFLFLHGTRTACIKNKKLQTKPAECPGGHWQVFAGGWWSHCDLEPSAALWDSAGFLMGRVC